MYSLLMHGADEQWDSGTADVERDRFLEHTDKAIAERFKPLDDNILAELKSYPVLFAYEIPHDRAAPPRLDHSYWSVVRQYSKSNSIRQSV